MTAGLWVWWARAVNARSGTIEGMKWPCCTVIAVGVVVGLTSLAGCGGHPPIPKRGVVEHDLGEWHFRRYQPVKDVEVWVEGNAAEGYTASYVRDRAEKAGH